LGWCSTLSSASPLESGVDQLHLMVFRKEGICAIGLLCVLGPAGPTACLVEWTRLLWLPRNSTAKPPSLLSPVPLPFSSPKSVESSREITTSAPRGSPRVPYRSSPGSSPPLFPLRFLREVPCYFFRTRNRFEFYSWLDYSQGLVTWIGVAGITRRGNSSAELVRSGVAGLV
jgi:hypothetical protein